MEGLGLQDSLDFKEPQGVLGIEESVDWMVLRDVKGSKDRKVKSALESCSAAAVLR